MSRLGRWTLCAAAAAMLVCLASPGAAQDVYEWTGGAPADIWWGTPGNWSPSTDAPGLGGGAGADARLSDTGIANSVVDLYKVGLGSPIYPELNLLRFEGITSSGYAIQDSGPGQGFSAGTLVLGGIVQTAGTNVISAALEGDGSFAATISGGTLTLSNEQNEFGAGESFTVTGGTLNLHSLSGPNLAVGSGGTAHVTADLNVASGATVSVASGGTLSAARVSVADGGLLDATGGVTVTERLALGQDYAINVAGGGSLRATGADLLAQVDRLALQGGTVSIEFASLPLPTAAWALDGNANATFGAVNGTAYNLTYNTDTPFAYAENRSASFNGTNAYVDFGTTLQFPNADTLTVSTWVKTTQQTTDNRHIFSKFLMNGDNRSWAVTINNGVLAVMLSANGTWTDTVSKEYRSTALIRDNVWHHLAFSFEAGTLRLYLDGVELVGTVNLTKSRDGAVPTISDKGNAPLQMGARAEGDRQYQGLLDEAAIWNSALSPDEIAWLCENSITGIGGGAWPLGDTDIDVTASTTFDLGLGAYVELGHLAMDPGTTLTLAGSPAVGFAGATITGAGTAVLDHAKNVHLTRLTGLSDGGEDVELVKRGAGELVLSREGSLGAGSAITVEGGTLTLGAGGAAGSAAIELGGGDLRLASIGSPASLVHGNAVSVTTDAAIVAGKSGMLGGDDGPLGVTLDAPVAVAFGARLTLGARDGYSLGVTGAIDDGAGSRGGSLAVHEGVVGLGGAVNAAAVTVTGGEASFAQSLAAGTFCVSGGVVNLDGAVSTAPGGEGRVTLPGTIAYYSFDDPSDWGLDGSGRDYHGTPGGTGTQHVAGAVGGALSFNGSGSINLPVIDPHDGPFTFSTWVQWNPEGSTTTHGFFGYGETGVTAGLIIYEIHPASGIRWRTGATDAPPYTAPLPQQGEWANLVLVNDGSQNIYYLNGVEVWSNPAPPGGPVFGDRAWRAIGDSWYAGRGFRGLMDEVYLFDHALSPGEIAALYEAPSLTNGDWALVSGGTVNLNSGASLDTAYFLQTGGATNVADGASLTAGLARVAGGTLNLDDGASLETSLLHQAGGATLLHAGATLDTPRAYLTGGTLAAGSPAALGADLVELDGGELLLSHFGGAGDALYNQPIVSAGGTLTAGAGGVGPAGPRTVVATGDVTVESGTLTLRSTDDYTLRVTGNIAYTGSPTAAHDLAATEGTVVFDMESGKTFSFDGTLSVAGAAVTVNDPVLSLGVLKVSDGALDLNADMTTNPTPVTGLHAGLFRVSGASLATLNFAGSYTTLPHSVFSGTGGLLAQTPIDVALSTVAVNELAARGPLPGATGENYQLLWTGTFTAQEDGQHVFRVTRRSDVNNGDIDDDGAFFFDFNGNGVFEASEGIYTAGAGNVTVNLVKGVSYNVAIGYTEYGGGEDFAAWLRTPTITAYAQVNPGAAAQAGMWSALAGDRVEISGGAVNVNAGATLTTGGYTQTGGDVHVQTGGAIVAPWVLQSGGSFTLDGALVNPGATAAPLALAGDAVFNANAALGGAGNEWALTLGLAPLSTGRPGAVTVYHANVADSVGQAVPAVHFGSTLVLSDAAAMGDVGAIDNAGLVVLAADGALGGENPVTVNLYRQGFLGGAVRIDVEQESGFPALDVPGYSALIGDLTGAVYRGPDRNVRLAENAILGWAGGELPLRTVDVAGAAYYLAALEFGSGALYQVGDDADDSPNGSIYKGLAIGRGWTPEGVAFEAEVHDISAAGSGIRVLMDRDFDVNNATRFDTDNLDVGVHFVGTGTVQFDGAVQLLGESQLITRTGLYDPVDGSGLNTTGDYTARLAAASAVGAGQRLYVERGALAVAHGAGVHAEGTVVLGPGGTMNIDGSGDGATPTSGTYRLEPGSFVRVTAAGRFNGGAAWEYDVADPGPGGHTAHDFPTIIVSDNFNLTAGAEPFTAGKANVVLASSFDFSSAVQIPIGVNRLVASSRELATQTVNQSVSLGKATGQYEPTAGSWVMVGAPTGRVLDINGNILLQGVNLVVNDHADVLYDLPANNLDWTLGPATLTGTVQLDGTIGNNVMQFNDLEVRRGYLRFGNSGQTMLGATSLITGKMIVRSGTTVELQAFQTALNAWTTGNRIAGQGIFGEGIYVDRGGYLDFRHYAAANTRTTTVEKIVFTGPDDGLLDPNAPGAISRFRLYEGMAADISGASIHHSNVWLQEGAFVGIGQYRLASRTEGLLSLRLVNSLEAGGSNAAQIARSTTDPAAFSWIDVRTVDLLGNPLTAESDRMTLYLGRLNDSTIPTVNVYGAIGAADTAVTISQIRGNLEFHTGSSLGAAAVVRSAGAAGFAGGGALPAWTGSITVLTGADGTGLDENWQYYLRQGRFEIGGNQSLLVHVNQLASGAAHVNVLSTSVRVLDDGNPASADAAISANNPTNAAATAVPGTVLLNRLEMEANTRTQLQPLQNTELNVRNLHVFGPAGSGATVLVQQSQGRTANVGPFSGLLVGNVDIGNVTGDDPSNVLDISGNRLELVGTLGIDVNVASASRMTGGFGLGGRTLTLGGLSGTAAESFHYLAVDPGAGSIVKNGTNALRVTHGHNGAAWTTTGGTLNVTLSDASGIQVYVDQGATNATPIAVHVPRGVRDVALTAALGTTGAGTGTVVLDGLSLGAGASAVITDGATDQNLSILKVDLGPDEGTLGLNGRELTPLLVTGNGTIETGAGGVLAMLPGTVLSPGHSAGTIEVVGSLETEGAAVYVWEHLWNGPDGSDVAKDQIDVDGDLSLDDGFVIRLAPDALPDGHVYEPLRPTDERLLMTFTGALALDPDEVVVLPGATGWDTDDAEVFVQGNGIYLKNVNASRAAEFDMVWDDLDGDWGLGANWSGDIAPTLLTTAVQNRAGMTATVAAPGAVTHRLEIGGAGATVQVGGATAGQLDVSANIDVAIGGLLDVRPNGTLHAGAINVEGGLNLLGAGSVGVIHADGATMNVGGSGTVGALHAAESTLEYAGTGAAEINLVKSAMIVGSGAAVARLRADDASTIDATQALGITERLDLGKTLTLEVAGGSIAASGANLVAQIGQLTLQGGTVAMPNYGGIPTPTAAWLFDGDFDGEWGGVNGTPVNDPGFSTTTPFAYDDNRSASFGGGNSVDFGNPDPLNITDAISVSTWIKTTDSSAPRYVFGKYEPAGTNRSWAVVIRTVDGVGVFEVMLSGDGTFTPGAKSYRSVARVNNDEWHHLAFTFEGTDDGTDGALRLYLDGVPLLGDELLSIAQDPAFGTINPTPAPLVAGARAGLSGDYNGLLDEAAIWNSVLSAEQVAWLYENSLASLHTLTSPLTHADLVVAASTTFDLGNATLVELGNLAMDPGTTLTLGGLPRVTFADATLDGSATLDSAVAVHLTRDAGISSGGTDVDFVKAGAGELVLSRPANVGAGSTVAVEGGVLTLGAGGAAGNATIELAGGDLRLAGIGSPGSLVFDNAVSVTGDAAIVAGESEMLGGDDGPLDLTLGSVGRGVAVAPGATLTLAARDSYSLAVADAIDDGADGRGGHLVLTEGDVSLHSAKVETAAVTGGSLTLTGGDLAVGRMNVLAGSVDTGAHDAVVSERVQLGATTLSISAGSEFRIAGADLSAEIERLTLQGGTVLMAHATAPAPTAAWAFDGNPAGLVGGIDGNANNAAWSNDAPFACAGNQSLSLDGTGYVNFGNPESLRITDAMTVSTWIKTESAGGQTRYFIGKWDSTGNQQAWAVTLTSDGTFQTLLSPNGAFDANERKAYRSTASIHDGQWHHLAFTFAGTEEGSDGTLKLYLNGVELAGADLNVFFEGTVKSIFDSTASVIAGAPGNLDPARFHQGLLDEVAVWDSVFSPDEIAWLSQNSVIAATGAPPALSANTDVIVAASTTLDLGGVASAALRDLAFNSGTTLTLAGVPQVSFNDVTGNGTVVGNVAVRGALAPGNSFGIIGVDGDLVLDDTSTYAVQLAGRGPTLVHDQVNVTGTLTIDEESALTLNWAPSDSDSMFGGVYRIATYGLLDGEFAAPTAENSNVINYIYDIDYEADGGAAIDLVLYDLLAGDADLDGKVDVADYVAVARNFGVGTNWLTADVTFDGKVDVADYVEIARNFGAVKSTIGGMGVGGGFTYEPMMLGAAGGGGPAVVPEPGMWTMLTLLAAIGGMVSLVRRRRAT